MLTFDISHADAKAAVARIAHHAGEAGTAKDVIAVVGRGPDEWVLVTTTDHVWQVQLDHVVRVVELADDHAKLTLWRDGVCEASELSRRRLGSDG